MGMLAGCVRGSCGGVTARGFGACAGRGVELGPVAKKKKSNTTPVFHNRKARHDYDILETLEVGIALEGTEVRALREGDCSIAEGFVEVRAVPPGLVLHGAMIGPYAPAGPIQHTPTRRRILLAHKREIEKWARAVDQKGVTVVPLKLYFKGGLVKLEIGLARGRAQHDKRRAIAERQTKRDLDRVMSRFQK